MLREIQQLRTETVSVLKKKNVDYSELRSALTSSQNRREVALIFDTSRISSSWYGFSVFEQIIPLLDVNARFSMLVGDYLGGNKDQEFLEKAMRDALNYSDNLEFKHSTQFYIVYLNNMTDAQITQLDAGLDSWQVYVR